jgi:hypothetical protein
MTAAEKLKIVSKLPCKVVMTADEYHRSEAIGSTSLKHVLRSPAHYLHAKENPQEKPAFNFGRAVHMAILEPNVFASTVVVMPEFWGLTRDGKKTNSPNSIDVKEQREKWLLQNHGNTIVTADEMADILLMAKALSKHKTARALLTGGAAEESYFDTCPETGLARKCRPDFLRGNIIPDIKSTTNAHPAAFVKEIAKYNYHVSAAYYLDIVSSVLGQTFDQFIIIAIEKTAPFGVSVHLLDDAAIEEGRKLYKKALKTLAECQKTNNYPAYPDAILSATLPNWAYTAEYE